MKIDYKEARDYLDGFVSKEVLESYYSSNESKALIMITEYRMINQVFSSYVTFSVVIEDDEIYNGTDLEKAVYAYNEDKQ